MAVKQLVNPVARAVVQMFALAEEYEDAAPVTPKTTVEAAPGPDAFEEPVLGEVPIGTNHVVRNMPHIQSWR